jgi:hypothetical protein
MLTVVPMLRPQRDLLDIPRGLARFRRYLEVMIGGTDDFVLPLQAFNPMSKPHVAEVLDALMGLNAEEIVVQAAVEAERRLGLGEVELRVGLVVVDDVGGGWTDRELIEAHGLRRVPTPVLRRGWLVIGYWAGEPVSERKVREEVLAGIYGQLDLQRHGAPQTLRQMMDLQGRALAFAGVTGPTLDAEELAYTHEVIGPHRETDDFPTAFACLFGDAAARRVGYTPLGLSPRAGVALALAEARASEVTPEEAFHRPGDLPAIVSREARP